MGAGRIRDRSYHPDPDAQNTRQTDISRISTNFLRKLSTGTQRKRRTMMPRGPKGEKRPADAIGNAVMIAKIATGLRISNRPREPAGYGS